MAQQLIVEGKDAVVLTNILIKRRLNPPKGYRNPNKYKKEFVKEAGSENLINDALKATLEKTEITNIGVIIDADQIGVNSRFSRTISLIEETLNISLPADKTFTPEGFSWEISDTLKIGIWIMPNNQDNGYLEHFLLQLIDTNNPTFQFAQAKLAELMTQNFCEFTAIKKEKALLHTYLAWQKNPGLPMGSGSS